MNKPKPNKEEWPLKPRGQRPLDWAKLSPDQREYVSPSLTDLAKRMHGEGASYTDIGTAIGVSRWVAKRVIEESRREAA